MIAGCGHVPELECPEALLDRVRPFLEAVDAGRALPAPAR
jgi:pimeloyl-ACP methyl ester carboxylesterase